LTCFIVEEALIKISSDFLKEYVHELKGEKWDGKNIRFKVPDLN